MRKINHLFLLLSAVIFAIPASGQSFTNGELNGTVGISSIPTGWSSVPYTDPVCQATGSPQSTADVCNATGPALSSGIAGIPHSGSTMLTGLLHVMSTSTWHEGIMQTVTGLTPGSTYGISLWQANVKQTNALDQTGAWMLYMDNTLIGQTAATYSGLAYNDVNLNWEKRVIYFTATSSSHVIKFLPGDDDANHNASTESVRMGLDSITLFPASVLPQSETFEASQTGGHVNLDWDAVPDVLYREFIVDRSEDGIRFETLIRRTADGSERYRHTDRSPLPGRSYYRIGIRTWDGGIRYTQVRAIDLEAVPFDLYWADNTVYSVAASGAFELQVLDLQGREVYREQMSSELDLSHLGAGMYVIRAADPSNPSVTVSKRILIRH